MEFGAPRAEFPTRKYGAIMSGMKHSHNRKHTQSHLAVEQLGRILAIANSDPTLHDLHDIVVVFGYTRIARYEFEQARWVDVHPHEHYMSVANAHSDGAPHSIELLDIAMRSLEALHARRPNSKCILGETPRSLLEDTSKLLN
jgi:hypothetical protein